jgi:putative DNA primase/helicase
MPAMLARISSRDGKLAAIHRTYLHRQDGKYLTQKKITKTSREWSGGAIRLFSTKGEKRMIVGEGIETVLSVRAHIHRMHGIWIPCWAAVSANNLERVALPEHIENIMIAGDNDDSFTGQKSAFILANRLTVHDKRKCTVALPSKANDFNDQLNGTDYSGTANG